MNGAELYLYLQSKQDELNNALKIAKERGITLANAEREYRVARAKFIAKARSEKVAAILINDLAKGDAIISKLREERDVAKVLYYNSVEAINVFKLQCRLIESQVQREWNHA